ncbi:hypothetical protein BD779DRAFT_1786028 [Infundibulicybe gibba]|nr:hypothetical protein BD779DRAFT_1786028 [Infundibulicybe gibba]
MPPPPDPRPAPGILEQEFDGLSGCLKNTALKVGQIYGFYADSRKLGIDRHAPHPPQSLTASVGREIEKYDQLCDAIESHLLRAISVLQRDLRREEKRIADAEAASSSNLMVTDPLPPEPTATAESTRGSAQPTPTNSPPAPSSANLPGRRPSAISISSLHRPAFPLKLDLSSTALRISPEEASMFSTGLASPVTLAPKSARALGPNEFPPELMAAFAPASSVDVANRTVDIDLTVPDNNQVSNDVEMIMDSNVGSSADKPIELDLESMEIDMATMTDLFGDADSSSNDANNAVDGLFSPVVGGPENSIVSSDMSVKMEKDERVFLDALEVGHRANEDDIFTSVNTNTDNSVNQALKGPALSSQSVPSPGSILAGFPSPSQLNALDSIDLSNLDAGFFGNDTEGEMNFSMDMEFLGMGAGV